jgi:hypothetical protein
MSEDQGTNNDLHVLFGAGQVGRLLAQLLLDANKRVRVAKRSPGERRQAPRSLGKPEPLSDGGLGQGNLWIVKDLIEAIEQDRQPLGSIYDGRAALKMIMVVYEAYRLKRPMELPLSNRQHPLTLL